MRIRLSSSMMHDRNEDRGLRKNAWGLTQGREFFLGSKPVAAREHHFPVGKLTEKPKPVNVRMGKGV